MNFERKRDVILERDRLQKQIAEQEKIICELVKEKGRNKGNAHYTGIQCEKCVNLLSRETSFGLECMCKLDVRCKDRKESNL